MGENLVIVESPAKAKTIEKFLGSGYSVKSSFGHIRDLSKKNLGINIDDDFKPNYEVSADKKKVVSELKSAAKKAGTVWLASDEDREGEAIAWHLQDTLELDLKKTKRIVFHEITKDAILNAIENPRAVDMNLVMAQQTRRVLDRLVGFEISPILWKRVKSNLSAGRVQSVALRLIVEKEREVLSFSSKSFYKVEGVFASERNSKSALKAEIETKFEREREALSILESCNGADFTIASIEKKESKRSPSAPFTTSTLQQEASRKLGFSLNQTMRVAQTLYESGFITYMRTDSTNLSKLALSAAKKTIIELYGERYSKTKQYATKSKGAQEAHEAIRPTFINNIEIDAGSAEKRLYSLIWKRTIASQMSDANIEKTEIKIGSDKISHHFKACADRVVFDGFLKVYTESKDDETEEESSLKNIPDLKIGERLYPKTLSATQKFSSKPARYTEASLVKKLEELGIGRPSTYAPTISTIIQRGYVVKENRPGYDREFSCHKLEKGVITHSTLTEVWGAEKGKLFPEEIGMIVTDFLIENFESILDYGFTAKIETDLDKIAEGKLVWNKLIKEFYTPFHQKVEESLHISKSLKVERNLGIDPKSGKVVIVRMGKFGPLAQVGANDDPEKRFAGLTKGLLLESVTLKDALKLFELPRVVGEYEDKIITAATGRFGPYIKYADSFISIGKDNDPYTIDLETSIQLIQNHSKRESEKKIKIFEKEKIEILNGRYGAYIKCGKNNYKIPKGIDPKTIDVQTALKIVADSDSKKGKAKK